MMNRVVQHYITMPPGGLPVEVCWGETLGQTQSMRKGLQIPFGLNTLWKHNHQEELKNVTEEKDA